MFFSVQLQDNLLTNSDVLGSATLEMEIFTLMLPLHSTHRKGAASQQIMNYTSPSSVEKEFPVFIKGIFSRMQLLFLHEMLHSPRPGSVLV